MTYSLLEEVSRMLKQSVAQPNQRTRSPSTSTTSANANTTDPYDEFQSNSINTLRKNVRNVTKKLANIDKTEAILKCHADKSLDELVKLKVINDDQKAQVLKKPALQAQLKFYEEALDQHKTVHAYYRQRHWAEKEKSETIMHQLVAKTAAEVESRAEQECRQRLLILSQFLRLAAFNREDVQEAGSDANQAIEGVLLAIYAGDDSAVESMLKLVKGADEPVESVPGEQLKTTYGAVKALAEMHKPASTSTTAPSADEGPVQTGLSSVTASPTETASPSLPETVSPTETESVSQTASSNEIAKGPKVEPETADGTLATSGRVPETPHLNGHLKADAVALVENKAASGEAGNSSSQQVTGMVKVPEEESGASDKTNGTLAPQAGASSWADDQPEPDVGASSTVSAGSGGNFHPVQHPQGRPSRDGGNNSRGRGRDAWRGRGRGRGRASNGAPFRGPRRTEES